MGAGLCLALAGISCSTRSSEPGPATLVLAAYTAPKEVYEQAILPAFQRHWKEKTGQDVRFETSYRGSEQQVCAILMGLPADVAALSHAGDLDKLQRLEFIAHDWTLRPHHGIVSRSIVVLAVRAGNPLGIHDWPDLVRPGLAVLTPNPTTSGGGRWNINALYGAALRGFAGVTRGKPDAAQGFLRDVFRNVTAMDNGARESIANFEGGAGDVAITYESEALGARLAGETYDYVVPRSTILIENPVAVLDKNADLHGVRKVADAFVEFLWTPEAQQAFADHGFRPVDPEVARRFEARFPRVDDLWRIEVLGGWDSTEEDLYGPKGRFTHAFQEVRRVR
jgi:sulfate transport system substrate-binding protein